MRRTYPRTGAPSEWTSVALPLRSQTLRALLLVRPFAVSRRLLRPLLTSRSAPDPASPFQAQGEISPGKNTDLPRTTAGSTPPPLGHGSFAVTCPLAPVGSASYPVLVHRSAGSFHASFRRSVALPPLRFPSFAVTCSGEDFHLQVCAHAGRTTSAASPAKPGGLLTALGSTTCSGVGSSS